MFPRNPSRITQILLTSSPLTKPTLCHNLSPTLTLSFPPAMSTFNTTSPSPWPIKPYTPRHATWPYSPSDFTRQDPSSDPSFYSSPRFVTHIDDAAIATLRSYYSTVLPPSGRILDFCSSWISHYPTEIEQAAKPTSNPSPPASSPPSPPSSSSPLLIFGLGLNGAELKANPVLNAGTLVHDLNEDPDIASALRKAGFVQNAEDSQQQQQQGEKLVRAATNVVSTDYLTRPVEVLRSLREVMEPGGRVHLVISNRCFPTKAIARWLRVGEEERVLMVGDFLHFAGWKRIEIVELSNGSEETGVGATRAEGGLRGLMSMMGMRARDPLWVVRAVKE